jgi:hypothetical protein
MKKNASVLSNKSARNQRRRYADQVYMFNINLNKSQDQMHRILTLKYPNYGVVALDHRSTDRLYIFTPVHSSHPTITIHKLIN